MNEMNEVHEALQDKLENAYKRIVALQAELNRTHKTYAEEMISLKETLQKTQKIAETAEQKIKKAQESARNSKERAKRLKRKIERLEKLEKLGKLEKKVLTNSSHKNESDIPSIG